MNDAGSPTDAPDLLGRRRCPNCLYDRRGLDAASPCPECGYRTPAGLTVLTFPRTAATAPKWPWMFVVMAALIGEMVTQTPTERAVFLVGLLPTATVVGLLAARVAWSHDAFTQQLWISRDGIGFERDADRFSPLRPITGATGKLLGILPLFFGFSSGAHSVSSAIWRWVVIATIVAIVLAVLTFERSRLAMPRFDAVAPRMFAWSRLRELTVGPAKRGAVPVRAKFVRPRVLPLDLRLAGDDALAAEIGRAMEAARAPASAHAVVHG